MVCSVLTCGTRPGARHSRAPAEIDETRHGIHEQSSQNQKDDNREATRARGQNSSRVKERNVTYDEPGEGAAVRAEELDAQGGGLVACQPRRRAWPGGTRRCCACGPGRCRCSLGYRVSSRSGRSARATIKSSTAAIALESVLDCELVIDAYLGGRSRRGSLRLWRAARGSARLIRQS